jgi:hypothetical protein
MDLIITVCLALALGAVVGFIVGIWRASCTTGRPMLSILRGGKNGEEGPP